MAGDCDGGRWQEGKSLVTKTRSQMASSAPRTSLCTLRETGALGEFWMLCLCALCFLSHLRSLSFIPSTNMN